MNYKPFSITTILKSSAHSLKGAKGALWSVNLSGSILTALAAFVIFLIVGSLYQSFFNPQDLTVTHKLLQQLILIVIVSLVFAPFMAGTLMVAIKRARGNAVTMDTGFKYFKKWMPLSLILFISSLIAMIVAQLIIGFIPLFLQLIRPATPLGAYTILFSVLIFMLLVTLLVKTFLLFSMPIFIEHNKPWWQAMIQSCRLVATHWLKVYGTIIITVLVALASLLPLILCSLFPSAFARLLGALVSVILLVWVVPYVFLIIGHVYIELNDPPTLMEYP